MAVVLTENKFSLSKLFLACMLILVIVINKNSNEYNVECHGRLMEPPARNVLWRFGFKAPPNYNDNELFCGGISSIVTNKGKCGICGDPYDKARIHETGGLMATNTTTRNYFPGSSIDIMIDIVANHGGLFRFEVCWRDDLNVTETEDCFEELPISGRRMRMRHYHREHIIGRDESQSSTNKSTKFDPLFDYELDPSLPNGMVSLSVDLPQDKTCEHCIFRWHWTVANNWGTCTDGSGAIGCGYQEVYRNCADVSVSRSGAGVGIGFGDRRSY